MVFPTLRQRSGNALWITAPLANAVPHTGRMTRELPQIERDALRLLGAGRSAREIAEELGISQGTVLWLIGNVVAERGARDTDAIANSLARPRRLWSSLVVPLAATIVLTLGVGALAKTGIVHLAGPAATAAPAIESASPTTLPARTAPARTFAPNAPAVEPPANGPATAAPIAPPTSAPPVTAPPPPNLRAPLPTASVLPIPIPPLPTLPPLPTPHLPVPLTTP